VPVDQCHDGAVYLADLGRLAIDRRGATPPATGTAVIPAALRSRARPARDVPLGSFAELSCQKIVFDLQLADLPIQNINLRLAGRSLHPSKTLAAPSNFFQQRYCLSDLSDAEITEVLRSYFIEFYDLAASKRADALTDALVAAHNLPHR
jgi:hypothetical protein